jgi:hypothetical protein
MRNGQKKLEKILDEYFEDVPSNESIALQWAMSEHYRVYIKNKARRVAAAALTAGKLELYNAISRKYLVHTSADGKMSTHVEIIDFSDKK